MELECMGCGVRFVAPSGSRCPHCGDTSDVFALDDSIRCADCGAHVADPHAPTCLHACVNECAMNPLRLDTLGGGVMCERAGCGRRSGLAWVYQIGGRTLIRLCHEHATAFIDNGGSEWAACVCDRCTALACISDRFTRSCNQRVEPVLCNFDMGITGRGDYCYERAAGWCRDTQNNLAYPYCLHHMTQQVERFPTLLERCNCADCLNRERQQAAGNSEPEPRPLTGSEMLERVAARRAAMQIIDDNMERFRERVEEHYAPRRKRKELGAVMYL